MENGHWSPIRDGIVDKIKTDRPASIGDFALIITQLYRRETYTSVSHLAKSLHWSQRKVRGWLEKMGLEIESIGKSNNPNGGTLRAIPKENLDPDNSNFWVVLPTEKPAK